MATGGCMCGGCSECLSAQGVVEDDRCECEVEGTPGLCYSGEEVTRCTNCCTLKTDLAAGEALASVINELRVGHGPYRAAEVEAKVEGEPSITVVVLQRCVGTDWVEVGFDEGQWLIGELRAVSQEPQS